MSERGAEGILGRNQQETVEPELRAKISLETLFKKMSVLNAINDRITDTNDKITKEQDELFTKAARIVMLLKTQIEKMQQLTKLGDEESINYFNQSGIKQSYLNINKTIMDTIGATSKKFNGSNKERINKVFKLIDDVYGSDDWRKKEVLDDFSQLEEMIDEKLNSYNKKDQDVVKKKIKKDSLQKDPDEIVIKEKTSRIRKKEASDEYKVIEKRNTLWERIKYILERMLILQEDDKNDKNNEKRNSIVKKSKDLNFKPLQSLMNFDAFNIGDKMVKFIDDKVLGPIIKTVIGFAGTALSLVFASPLLIGGIVGALSASLLPKTTDIADEFTKTLLNFTTKIVAGMAGAGIGASIGIALGAPLGPVGILICAAAGAALESLGESLIKNKYGDEILNYMALKISNFKETLFKYIDITFGYLLRPLGIELYTKEHVEENTDQHKKMIEKNKEKLEEGLKLEKTLQEKILKAKEDGNKETEKLLKERLEVVEKNNKTINSMITSSNDKIKENTKELRKTKKQYNALNPLTNLLNKTLDSLTDSNFYGDKDAEEEGRSYNLDLEEVMPTLIKRRKFYDKIKETQKIKETPFFDQVANLINPKPSTIPLLQVKHDQERSEKEFANLMASKQLINMNSSSTKNIVVTTQQQNIIAMDKPFDPLNPTISAYGSFSKR